MTKVRFIVAALAAFFVAFLLFAWNGSTPLSAQQGQLHNCPEPGKWAISVWEGQDGIETSQALDTCGADSIDAAYYLDADSQNWLRYFSDHPEVNSLLTLSNWQGIVAHGKLFPSLTPTPTPAQVAQHCTPEELHLSDINEGFGHYGGMLLAGYQDADTFTMTLDGDDWASVGIDLVHFWDEYNEGKCRDLSCYKYMVVRARGAKGGEEFRTGLGIGPVDYLFDGGLTTQWQDITFDIEQIWDLDERECVVQVGFEIGPDWTNNTIGTTIHIDGVKFTNQPTSLPVP